VPFILLHTAPLLLRAGVAKAANIASNGLVR